MDPIPKYREFRTNRDVAEAYLADLIQIFQDNGFIGWVIEELAKESGPPEKAYPGQGLLFTGREGWGDTEPERVTLPDEIRDSTIQAWLYYLFLNNHPERLAHLFETSEEDFKAPKKKRNSLFSNARKDSKAITVADLALEPGGSHRKRRSRNDLHASGPFVSSHHVPGKISRFVKAVFNRLGISEKTTEKVRDWLAHWGISKKTEGRNQARGVFATGANPEITGSPMALATLAMSHSLVSIPRDGLFQDIQRQVDLTKKAIEWIDKSPIYHDKTTEEKTKLREFYIHNLVGVIEPSKDSAERRARALYEAGVRTFRIYSPEPGDDLLYTLKRLREVEAEEGWEPIEIFVGQVVDVAQAIDLEKAGADAIYIGIGGGGRCTTGVVAGLTINWVQLVWELRGKINIPVIVEGGANDNIGPSLAAGVSHIGVVGKFAGTIETPGGLSFFRDKDGNLFVFYGGEASDRMRAMAERFGPLGIIQNKEGGSTVKYIQLDENTYPTLLQVLDILGQGVVGSFVFQNVNTVEEMQDKGANRLVLGAINDGHSRNTH